MSQAKERPILFSGQMVRAILNGQKTVTRRPVKEWQQPSLQEDGTWFATAQRHQRWGFGVTGADAASSAAELVSSGVCPYGRRGDRLWVREAWLADAQLDSIAPRDLSQGEPIFYPADGSLRQTGCAMVSQGRGRPSIHMPRWASRILLEITAVRVERLQDISDEQCLAEGTGLTEHAVGIKLTKPLGESLPKAIFKDLWVSINGPAAWDANPWVWVVEFKRIEP